ncbi:hypothetical protein QZH56_26100 [Streptomyces olivoreticuli]|uniref:Uncharacterized protein n=1 Tax=Streptomyces blastmyceticus TaxID=68180 RepID=A0ABN0XFV8_9ACTN|nr:hypothetical protein [Streptomyces olivoreticuli]WKK22245.1 hypothetical protein QZH56_26100 [Streptomyces olivoreticuli]
MNRAYRLALTGALGAALVAGGATAAFAAAPTAAISARPALTAQASTSAVNAWQEFKVTGKATAIKPGTHVTLQQKQGAKWVSLPATVAVDNSHAYAMRVKLGIKGKNTLRVTGGQATSPEFTVTVR